MTQLSMFETEDLPLFSGTAQQAGVESFDPQPQHHQASFAKCHFCNDTGRTSEGCCWCEAGRQAKQTCPHCQWTLEDGVCNNSRCYGGEI